MNIRIWFSVLALASTTFSYAVPKPDGEQRGKHVVDKELSDEPHEKDGEHNPEYDHEAFLGEQEAKTFDQLSPEESKERLGVIVDKIDKDHDGQVTENELKDWIKYVQTRYVSQDTERQWKEHTPENDLLTWELYEKRTYGFLDEDEYKEEKDQYTAMMERDRRRWEMADSDKDNKLTKEEFGHFLHPEEADHMKDVVVKETMEDIDKDKDGFISLEEYIGDMWPNENKEPEPDWVKSEKEQFSTSRDKDNDGKMSFEEVKDWVLPSDYDHVDAEAKHLMHEADTDKDGVLSKAEILENHETFVGSQATDYGEALTRHDEF